MFNIARRSGRSTNVRFPVASETAKESCNRILSQSPRLHGALHPGPGNKVPARPSILVDLSKSLFVNADIREFQAQVHAPCREKIRRSFPSALRSENRARETNSGSPYESSFHPRPP